MRVRFLLAATLWGFAARVAGADTAYGPADTRDRYEFSAQSETYAGLFRRALLPGPNGSLVSSDTAAPLHEYVTVRARDVDAVWRRNSLDFEVAAWGRAWLGARVSEPPFDGDLQSASVRYRHGPLWLRLGRQLVAGGAARFARFDGLHLDAELGSGFQLAAYGGFTVLSRWNERPRYEHLGSFSDSEVREEDLYEAAPRGLFWLAGARLGYAVAERRAGLSFHEQREAGGLSRRDLGVEGRARFSALADIGGNAVLDVDRRRIADARLWLDLRPVPGADVSLEYLHTEPALFLSHQSVLSAFGGATYDQLGADARVRVTSQLDVAGAGFLEVYADARPGARAQLSARWFPDSARRTFLRVAYARVQTPDNGYHSLRSSFSRLLSRSWRTTFEAYAYWYDQAIRGYRSSTVNAGTLSFDATRRLSVLWGASVAHSPYASLDAQTELRVTFSLDENPGGGAR